jgi:hypothetical protein
MTLAHGANTSQIGTGDLLIERVVRNGGEVQLATSLRFVFATVPALASYSDTAGNSATIPYPVASGGPGTRGNGLPVATGPGGQVVINVALWRPQRRPIAPETGAWIDIGGLTHIAVIQHIGPLPGGTTVQRPCPQSSYSTADPELALPPPHILSGGLTDLAPDRLQSTGETLTYALNLRDCLASLGVTWAPGEELDLNLEANVSQPGVAAGASQSLVLERQ